MADGEALRLSNNTENLSFPHRHASGISDSMGGPGFPISRARVRFYLAARNRTQRSLAEAVGVDESVLSSAICGHRRLSIENAEAIARELGVDVEDLRDIGQPVDGREDDSHGRGRR